MSVTMRGGIEQARPSPRRRREKKKKKWEVAPGWERQGRLVRPDSFVDTRGEEVGLDSLRVL